MSRVSVSNFVAGSFLLAFTNKIYGMSLIVYYSVLSSILILH